MAQFTSVVDAVQCAVAVQRGVSARNTELPKMIIRFRIGINIGDVIQEGDRIYGDRVNIAARLEGFADRAVFAFPRQLLIISKLSCLMDMILSVSKQ